MKAKLISRDHGDFEIGETATIGRSGECAVTIDAAVISSEHARISFDSKRSAYLLEDLDSLNGTRLDGVSVERPELLGKLNLIELGGSEVFIFQLVSAEEVSELDTIDLSRASKTQVGGEVPVVPETLREGAEETIGVGTQVEKDVVPVPEKLAEAGAAATPATAEPEPPIGSSPFFLEFRLDKSSPRFALEEGDNLVGRSKSAGIRLDFRDLSRRHATLIVAGGKVLVRDEDSRNHTFVDGRQVEGEVEVAGGAKIVFGRLEARLIERRERDGSTKAGEHDG